MTIKIDVPDREKSSGYIVKGRIHRADGSPFAGAVVHAFDKDLRSEETLGEAKTDKQGKYEVKLNMSDLLIISPRFFRILKTHPSSYQS